MDVDPNSEPRDAAGVGGAGAGISGPDEAGSGPTARSPHNIEGHRWVVRTPDGDKIAAATRLSTMWPLLRMYSVRSLRLRFRQSALGLSWTIFQPIAILAIYGFVFTRFLNVTGGGLPYLSVAWAGLTVWMFIQAGVQGGTVALLGDAWIISKVWFPREVVPMAPVAAGLVDLAVALVLLLVIVIVQGVGLSYQIVALPLVLAVIVIWVMAVTMFAATITVFFRDMATIIALGLRLAFIATPVMYPQSQMPPQYNWLAEINPITVVINGVRDTVLMHTWPSWKLLAAQALLGSALLFVALRYLRAVERRMVDII